MKITAVRTLPLEVTLPQPVFDANYQMATKPALLVEVQTDQGLTGLGESAHFGGPMLSGCGSWGGRCLSLGDYVTRRGPADEATAAGGG